MGLTVEQETLTKENIFIASYRAVWFLEWLSLYYTYIPDNRIQTRLVLRSPLLSPNI